jgi:hypothetical protein
MLRIFYLLAGLVLLAKVCSAGPLLVSGEYKHLTALAEAVFLVMCDPSMNEL